MSTFAWVCDYDPHTTSGGAELSDRATILAGIRRGHEVRVILPVEKGALNIEGCDATIISNATRHPPELLNQITVRNPTIFYIHDFFPTCSWRLFYPMAERCLKTCPATPYASTMLTKAALLVWLSPLHRQAWLKKHPELEYVPFHLHPSPIDVVPFEEAAKRAVRKPGTVLGSNVLAPFKGREKTLKYVSAHPELQFTFIGNPDGVKVPENVKVVQHVEHTRMPSVLSKFESVLLLPASPQPFERLPVEARAAGCKLILNDLVGCTSYPWWPSWAETRKAVTESPTKFWERVEEVV